MSNIELGFGLYRHMLTPEYYQFAEQCGSKQLVIHLANYYGGKDNNIVTATDGKKNYGVASADDPIWSLDSLLHIKKEAAEWGQQIYAIENFSPAMWYDVLLDGPKRTKQMEDLKRIIDTVGKAGIKSFGYNFSLAGVWGHQKKRAARGKAISTCFDSSLLDLNCPIPNGEVWNMTYDDSLTGIMAPVTSDMLWDRLERFLKEILPVAENAGVEMALHPDDPPMPELRNTPRLVYRPEMYSRLLEISNSPSNKIEFCMGSIQEMQGITLDEAIDNYAKDISYVHFRNVKGKVPNYDEVFVDEGDIDMINALKRLHDKGFKGIMIPDHTPLMQCESSWHCGMAYAMGYMNAALKMIEEEK